MISLGRPFSKNEIWRIKLVGHKKPAIGENNVEWLIDFKGMQPPWAWWLSNYTYYRNNSLGTNITSSIKKIPVPINGTYGFRNNTDVEYVWCLIDDLPNKLNNGTIIFYYNSTTDYRCVNASDNKEFLKDMEWGNGTNSTAKAAALWQNSNALVVWHFNDTTDASGQNNPASTSSAAYNRTSIFGMAVTLTGITGKWQLPSDNIYEGSGGWTMGVWIYPTSFALPESDFFTIWAGGVSKNIVAALDSSGTILTRVNGTSGSVQTVGSNGTLTLNNWNYVVITKNKGGATVGTVNQRVYLNGVLVQATTTDNNNISADGWGINRAIDSTSLNATFDEFRFLNVTLTDDEVKARYQILTPKYNWSYLGPEQSQTSGNANELAGDSAILQGIALSAINSSYTNYSSQQIYMRNITGQQKLGRFDVVASSENQRWVFNYVTSGDPTSNFTYMVNMTPVLYVWEAGNLTTSQISSQVKTLIDSTKI